MSFHPLIVSLLSLPPRSAPVCDLLSASPSSPSARGLPSLQELLSPTPTPPVLYTGRSRRGRFGGGGGEVVVAVHGASCAAALARIRAVGGSGAVAAGSRRELPSAAAAAALADLVRCGGAPDSRLAAAVVSAFALSGLGARAQDVLATVAEAVLRARAGPEALAALAEGPGGAASSPTQGVLRAALAEARDVALSTEALIAAMGAAGAEGRGDVVDALFKAYERCVAARLQQLQPPFITTGGGVAGGVSSCRVVALSEEEGFAAHARLVSAYALSLGVAASRVAIAGTPASHEFLSRAVLSIQNAAGALISASSSGDDERSSDVAGSVLSSSIPWDAACALTVALRTLGAKAQGRHTLKALYRAACAVPLAPASHATLDAGSFLTLMWAASSSGATGLVRSLQLSVSATVSSAAVFHASPLEAPDEPSALLSMHVWLTATAARGDVGVEAAVAASLSSAARTFSGHGSSSNSSALEAVTSVVAADLASTPLAAVARLLGGGINVRDSAIAAAAASALSKDAPPALPPVLPLLPLLQRSSGLLIVSPPSDALGSVVGGITMAASSPPLCHSHLSANVRAASLLSRGSLCTALNEFLSVPSPSSSSHDNASPERRSAYQPLPETLSLLLHALARDVGAHGKSATNLRVSSLPPATMPDSFAAAAAGGDVAVSTPEAWIALLARVLTGAESWGVFPRLGDVAAVAQVHATCGNARLALADIRNDRSGSAATSAPWGSYGVSLLYAHVLRGIARSGRASWDVIEWIAARAHEDGMAVAPHVGTVSSGADETRGQAPDYLAAAVEEVAIALKQNGVSSGSSASGSVPVMADPHRLFLTSPAGATRAALVTRVAHDFILTSTQSTEEGGASSPAAEVDVTSDSSTSAALDAALTLSLPECALGSSSAAVGSLCARLRLLQLASEDPLSAATRLSAGRGSMPPAAINALIATLGSAAPSPRTTPASLELDPLPDTVAYFEANPSLTAQPPMVAQQHSVTVKTPALESSVVAVRGVTDSRVRLPSQESGFRAHDSSDGSAALTGFACFGTDASSTSSSSSIKPVIDDASAARLVPIGAWRKQRVTELVPGSAVQPRTHPIQVSASSAAAEAGVKTSGVAAPPRAPRVVLPPNPALLLALLAKDAWSFSTEGHLPDPSHTASSVNIVPSPSALWGWGYEPAPSPALLKEGVVATAAPAVTIAALAAASSSFEKAPFSAHVKSLPSLFLATVTPPPNSVNTLASPLSLPTPSSDGSRGEASAPSTRPTVSAPTLLLEEAVRASHAENAELERELHALSGSLAESGSELDFALLARDESAILLRISAATRGGNVFREGGNTTSHTHSETSSAATTSIAPAARSGESSSIFSAAVLANRPVVPVPRESLMTLASAAAAAAAAAPGAAPGSVRGSDLLRSIDALSGGSSQKPIHSLPTSTVSSSSSVSLRLTGAAQRVTIRGVESEESPPEPPDAVRAAAEAFAAATPTELRVLHRGRAATLRSVLAATHAEVEALEAEVRKMDVPIGGAPIPAAHLFSSFCESEAELGLLCARLEEGVRTDEDAAAAAEDAVVTTRGGLRSWGGLGVGQALLYHRAGSDRESSPGSGGGGAPPNATAAAVAAMFSDLAATSTALLNTSGRALRRGRQAASASLANAIARSKATCAALDFLASQRSSAILMLRSHETAVKTAAAAAASEAAAADKVAAHAAADARSISSRLTALRDAHASEHARLSASIKDMRERVFSAVTATSHATLESLDALLAAADAKGRAGAAVEGAAALEALRAASQAQILRAMGRNDDEGGDEDAALGLGCAFPLSTHVRAVEDVAKWAVPQGALESALHGASFEAMRVRELNARVAVEEASLKVANEELTFALEVQAHLTAVEDARDARLRAIAREGSGGGAKTIGAQAMAASALSWRTRVVDEQEEGAGSAAAGLAPSARELFDAAADLPAEEMWACVMEAIAAATPMPVSDAHAAAAAEAAAVAASAAAAAAVASAATLSPTRTVAASSSASSSGSSSSASAALDALVSSSYLGTRALTPVARSGGGGRSDVPVRAGVGIGIAISGAGVDPIAAGSALALQDALIDTFEAELARIRGALLMRPPPVSYLTAGGITGTVRAGGEGGRAIAAVPSSPRVASARGAAPQSSYTITVPGVTAGGR